MAVTTKDLMRELRHLIYNKKIGEAIALLEQHKEQLQNAMENDITILYLHTIKRWKYYEQPLSSHCEIASDAKRDNQVQWLPFTPVSDTIELPPIHRLFKLLLEYGASVDGQDHIGRTPLHLAAEQGNGSMVRLLLQYSVNVNAQDLFEYAPLHLAINAGKESIVRLLLQSGADVNAQDLFGAPLHLAIRAGKESIVRLLLQSGAGVNVRNHERDTPLDLAVSAGKESIVYLLLANGASVDMQDRNGLTPLHRAVKSGDESMARLLLQYGASVDVQAKNGLTPFHRAVKSGDESIVRLLSEASNAKKIEQPTLRLDSSNSASADVSSNLELDNSLHGNNPSLAASPSETNDTAPDQQILDNEENSLQTSSAGQTTSWITSIYSYGSSLHSWWNAARTPSKEIFVEKEIVEKTFFKIQGKLTRWLISLECSANPDSNLIQQCLHYEGEIKRYHKEGFSVSAAELEKLNYTMDNLQERIDHNFMFESRQLSANTTGFFNYTLSGNTLPAIAPIDIPRLGY